MMLEEIFNILNFPYFSVKQLCILFPSPASRVIIFHLNSILLTCTEVVVSSLITFLLIRVEVEFYYIKRAILPIAWSHSYNLLLSGSRRHFFWQITVSFQTDDVRSESAFQIQGFPNFAFSAVRRKFTRG